MVAFFKLTSKASGELTAFFEMDVQGDNELDYLNSLKEGSKVKQISRKEYDKLMIAERDKCFVFDAQQV
ncbi:hypothetical protein OCK74_18935 [Chitinophagaceae bacterium LB-8]|uniref:Uncharacterized protein n=1 Tax=Paraflavisolibacter caeni TaxID=2982496 RepID=A0A9X2XPL4_9BACT|nr:hypothetical protein [Paraflavisolibacter caeni]MCU7551204.1 hypothetical protein [Paraflavisolibacter caeni]